jgi:hypothetical protein
VLPKRGYDPIYLDLPKNIYPSAAPSGMLFSAIFLVWESIYHTIQCIQIFDWSKLRLTKISDHVTQLIDLKKVIIYAFKYIYKNNFF